jgi:hypothetical protein
MGSMLRLVLVMDLIRRGGSFSAVLALLVFGLLIYSVVR